MPATSQRRPAGIRFVDQPPALPEKLPRMDIAVFVGFASTGPLHRPLVIEDAAAFPRLFGDDLPLAWDPDKGEQAYACLGAAVRAFFRNGGRRCWVIRVAGDAETTLFPLPGLMRLDGAGLEPAGARARSPGSGFDGLRAATALAARSFEVLGYDAQTLQVTLSRRDTLAAGDLLRLTFEDDPVEAFFIVQSAGPPATSPPDLRGGPVSVDVRMLGAVRWLAAEEVVSGPCEIEWPPLSGMPRTATGEVPLERESSPADPDRPVTIDVAVEFAPPPGTFVKVKCSDGTRLWLQVSMTQRTTVAGHGSRLVGRAFSWVDHLPAPHSFARPQGEKLTFELRAQRSDSSAMRIENLGFTPANARFWNALPLDADFYAGADLRESLERADASDYDALWSEAGEPRFPFAGAAERDGIFLPIGMSAVAEPAMAPEITGRSALERDGLADFSPSLFLDSRLLGSLSATLSANADFIRYQTPDAPALHGLHAALEVEEATLIAVPDAVHRGWHPSPEPDAPAPGVSQPRAHPAWWHFLECHPPASPPAASAPVAGHFLQCDLRVLPAPILTGSPPNAAGAFTLSWTGADADVISFLEEATQPDFSDAVELWRGKETTREILSRAPGIYYYRVRAEAGGETSEWSNGVPVPVRTPGRWALKAIGDSDADTLLDVHRALLRLCAARADIMAVISLPAHFDADDAHAYLERLKSPRDLRSVVPPLDFAEERALSYAAVYHPWLIVREESERLLLTPPDGAACGLIARRSIARGAWIAPANEALSGVVALAPDIAPARRLALLLAQLNLLRQEPHGFLALNADTLSEDPELRPINVRRLLILLRRAALSRGMTYVFEPNDLVLRRTAQAAFESLLQQLFMRGAFAGATPNASYRVVTDDTLNTPQDIDAGRFRVDLKVAPALPMSFLTVRLVQIGELATATEIF